MYWQGSWTVLGEGQVMTRTAVAKHANDWAKTEKGQRRHLRIARKDRVLHLINNRTSAKLSSTKSVLKSRCLSHADCTARWADRVLSDKVSSSRTKRQWPTRRQASTESSSTWKSCLFTFHVRKLISMRQVGKPQWLDSVFLGTFTAGQTAKTETLQNTTMKRDERDRRLASRKGPSFFFFGGIRAVNLGAPCSKRRPRALQRHFHWVQKGQRNREAMVPKETWPASSCTLRHDGDALRRVWMSANSVRKAGPHP